MIYLFAIIIISIAGVFSGALLFIKPAFCIEVQRKFYEKINWRIEPISMDKEIRNSRLMGLFLLAVSLCAILYIIKSFIEFVD